LDEGSSQPVDYCTLSYGGVSTNHHTGAGVFIYKQIVSPVKRVGIY